MKKTGGKNVIVAYVPVLHEGYMRFFRKHAKADALFLISKKIAQEYRPLVKDIRALPPETMVKAIRGLKLFNKTEIADARHLKKLDSASAKIIMPDELVMHDLHEKYFPQAKVQFDSVFLRWDEHKSFDNQAMEVDQEISKDQFDIEMMDALKLEAEKSSDFWRHIAAAIVKDGAVVLKTYNQAVPDKMLPYTEGDPRSDFKKGIHVEMSTSFHCEARLIAEAAQKGISLEGTSIYVTTFPCPPCAKLVAYSGIKKLYYADGYGVLDGERVLKSQGVKIVHVKMR